MTPFFDVDLKEVTQIIERGAGESQMFLLLDGRRFSVTLSDNYTTEVGTMFPGDVLPSGFAFVFAEVDSASFLRRRQKNSPPVVRHFDVIEMGPARRVGTGGGPEVHVKVHRAFRPHLFPPLKIVGLPAFERT